MKGLNPRFLWIIIALFAIIPTIYFFSHFTASAFRDNAMGNWFATMIGAFIGILIALEINRVQQIIQEKNERTIREKEEREHKAKILRLVKREIEYNRTVLLARQPDKKGEKHRKVLVNRLKDELWNAFSDGGELQWIKDLQLLDFISMAYYHIRTIIYLEDKYFEATHFPGFMTQQKEDPKDRILNYLTLTDPEVLLNLEQALQEIDKSLTVLESME